MTDIVGALSSSTELIAAAVGGLLGFGGAIWATTIQSHRDDKRALRVELTHSAVGFIENGEELAFLIVQLAEGKGRIRRERDREMEGAAEDTEIRLSAMRERREQVDDEMRKTIQFLRIGYPQLAAAATAFYDDVAQPGAHRREREHPTVVLVEILPVAKREFEMEVRLALGGKKPRGWRAELNLQELLGGNTVAADGKRTKGKIRSR